MEASTQSSDGQAPGGTPTSSGEPVAPDRKAAAEATKLEAEAKKAAVEAEKAERDLKFPAPTSKPLEGKLEVADGTGLIADLLTHALVDEGARETASEIDKALSNCARVLLVSDPELALSDWSHRSVRLSLDAYATAFEEARSALDEALGEPVEAREEGAMEVYGAGGDAGIATLSRFVMPAVGPAVAAASAIVGGVADVAAWFQADYSVKKRDVTVGETPLMSALAGRLASADRSIEVDGFSLLTNSPLLESFGDVLEARNELEARSAEAKARIVDPVARKREIEIAARKENASAIAKALGGKRDDSQPELLFKRETELVDSLKKLDANGAAAVAAAATATADAAIAAFDKLATTLNASGKEKAYPPLLAAALRERLHSEQSPHTHVLYAGLESVGGETVAKRSLFTGASIRYIGGAQLSYMLLDVKANTVVAAKTLPLLATTKLSLRFGSRGRVTRIKFRRRASRS